MVRSEVGQRDGQLKAVRRENRKRRKVIEDYQLMMSAGATGLHPVSGCLAPLDLTCVQWSVLCQHVRITCIYVCA